MIWYKTIGQLEIFFICLFTLFYLGYMVRIIYIVRKLKTGLSSIYLKLVLRSSYFALLIVSLLGPSFGDFKKEVKSVSKNIYIAIDLSESMNTRDLAPSRLEKALYETSALIDNLPGDRIGLIVFSSEAYVQCPLTFDHDALQMYLSGLTTDLLAAKGSDLSAPMKLAEIHFKANKNPDERTGILLLVTDGEDHPEEAKETIKKIRAEGIDVFVMGTGTEKGDRIPVGKGFKRDNTGHFITSHLNSTYLKDITTGNKQRYFEVSDKNNDLVPLIENIRKVKGTMTDIKKIDSTANKYFYFLMTALLLIIIDVLITVNTIRI